MDGGITVVPIDRSPFKGSVQQNLRGMLLYIIQKLSLKGQSQEIFCIRFFLNNQLLLVPLEIFNFLGPFGFLEIFHRVIGVLKWLSGVLITGELTQKSWARKIFQT